MEELRLSTETGEELPKEFFTHVKQLSPATLRLFLHVYIGENGLTEEQEDETKRRAEKTRELVWVASDELYLPPTPEAALSLLSSVETAAIQMRSAYRSLHPESANGVPAGWTDVDQLLVEPNTPNS